LLALLAAFIHYVTKQDLPAEQTVPTAINTSPAKTPTPEPEPEPARAVDQLQFYDILPNEKILPHRQPASSPTPRPSAQSEAPRQLWLQAGVFRQQSLADFRQEKIVSAGMPARVEAGKDATGETVFRVLAGPFANSDSHDRARRALIDSGIDAIPIHYSGVSP
jgi:cell division protein FtsN